MWTVTKWMRFINNLENQRKVTMEQRIHCDTNTPTINRIDIDRLFLLDHHLPMESAYIVSTFPFCAYTQLDRVSSFGRFYAHWASEWTSISGNVIHAHNIQEAKHQHTQHMQHALSTIGRVCSNFFSLLLMHSPLPFDSIYQIVSFFKECFHSRNIRHKNRKRPTKNARFASS